MKISRTVIILLFLSITSSLLAQDKTYQLTGTIDARPGYEKLYLTLTKFVPDGPPAVQLLNIEAGKFYVSGKLDEPLRATISAKKDFAKTDDHLQFFLDTGVQKVLISEKLSASVVDGSETQRQVLQYSRQIQPLVGKLLQFNQEAAEMQSRGLHQDTVWNKYRLPFKLAQGNMASFQRKFIADNPDSFISLLLIPELAQFTLDYFESDTLWNKLGAEIRMLPTAQMLSKHIAEQKPTSIGAAAIDFSLKDTLNTEVSLSSFRGKYVLLDFWAAWCGPCRQENPNVVSAYHRFKDHGFTVLGVSLDRERKDWLKAIQTDKLDWTHLSDLKFWASKPAKLYNVTSIPRNFLIDPEGRIIGRDLRGPDLHEKLSELFLN